MYSFYKMHGIGNDFIIFDDHEDFYSPFFDFSTLSKKVAQRRLAVGCDQVIFILKKTERKSTIRFFNNDGSEAENCGNGTRCAAMHFMQKNKTSSVRFESLGCELICKKINDHSVSVNSKKPSIIKDVILHPQDVFKQPGIHVNVGNPHLVILDPVDDFLSFGAMLENHTDFKNKTNVGFANVVNTDTINLQVWERGTGPTLACGSAACAAVTAAHFKGLCKNVVTVKQPGGKLKITIDSHTITQEGPIKFVFKGQLL